jgi:hypothetical protein
MKPGGPPKLWRISAIRVTAMPKLTEAAANGGV